MDGMDLISQKREYCYIRNPKIDKKKALSDLKNHFPYPVIPGLKWEKKSKTEQLFWRCSSGVRVTSVVPKLYPD